MTYNSDKSVLIMKNNNGNKFWDLKPFWCQPWSIILFGIGLLVSIWILFHNLILTSLVSVFIIVWWVLFLIIAPGLYQNNPMD